MTRIVFLPMDVRLKRRAVETTHMSSPMTTFIPGPATLNFKTADPWFNDPNNLGATVTVKLPNSDPFHGIFKAFHRMEGFSDVTLTETAPARFDPSLTEASSRYVNTDVKYIADELFKQMGIDPHPNCRCVAAPIEGGKDMAPKNKKTPKYYVASVAITRTLNPEADLRGMSFEDHRALDRGYPPEPNGAGYVKYTEKEAIDQAKALVEKDGMDRYVVKVIRRVRRAPRPVVVESV